MHIPKFSIIKQNMIEQKQRWLMQAISFLVLVLLAIFIIYPLFSLAKVSFLNNGSFTLIALQKEFSDPLFYEALKNTLILEGLIIILVTIFGGGLAFLQTKTDYQHKKLIDLMVFLSLCIPPYILAISLMQILGGGGYLERLINLIIPQVNYGYNVYNIFSCALVLSLHLYPFVYYGLKTTLQQLDGSLLSSAKIMGLGNRLIVLKIVLPLILPALGCSLLLVVSRSMANFGVVAELGLPSGIQFLTTRIYSSLAFLDLPVVAVSSLFLLIISLVLCALTNLALRRKYQLKASNACNYELKLHKVKFINRLIVSFFIFSIIIPYGTIIFSSFFKRWGLPLKLSNLTFNNYGKLFAEESILKDALFNSIGYGIIASLLAMSLAVLIVFLARYLPSKINQLLLNLSQLAIGIPNIVLAIAASFAWINPLLCLYGTKWIIIVTYAVLFLPIYLKELLACLSNRSKDEEEIAKIMGASLSYQFIHLYLPTIKDCLLNASLITLLISLKEIPISLLLHTVNTKTVGVILFTIQSNSYGLEMTSCVAVVVIGLSIVLRYLLKCQKGVKHELFNN